MTLTSAITSFQYMNSIVPVRNFDSSIRSKHYTSFKITANFKRKKTNRFLPDDDRVPYRRRLSKPFWRAAQINGRSVLVKLRLR